MRTALWACFVLAFVAASAAQQVQRVRCGSSTGDFVIEVHPDWSPNGAARFLDLVSSGEKGLAAAELSRSGAEVAGRRSALRAGAVAFLADPSLLPPPSHPSGFFTDSPLFRVVPGFIAQFGVGSTPEVREPRSTRQPAESEP